MTIDGHQIVSLPNGGACVISGSEKTYHADQDSAARHVARLATERAQYEARRVMEGRG